MTTGADLRRRFPGSIAAGGDAPGVVGPATQDETAALIAHCVMELDNAGRDEFVTQWRSGEWNVLAIVHPQHPELEELVAWASAADDVLLLVAFGALAPPAVLVIERDE